jgi:hypothetical protein
MFIECVSGQCPAGPTCKNNRFQNGKWQKDLEIFEVRDPISSSIVEVILVIPLSLY